MRVRLFDYLLYRLVGMALVGLAVWCFWFELPRIEDANVRVRDALHGLVSACEARNDPVANLEAALVHAGERMLGTEALAELKAAREATRRVRLYPRIATAQEVQDFWATQEAYRLTALGLVGRIHKANPEVQAQFVSVVEFSDAVTRAAQRYNFAAAEHNKTLHGRLASVTAYFAEYEDLPVLGVPPVQL